MNCLTTDRVFITYVLLLSCLIVNAPQALAADSKTQISILSQNMNRLFDDVDNGNNEKVIAKNRFKQRIKTTVSKIAKDYKLPDIIALQEIENANVLLQLAKEIYRRFRVSYRQVIIPGQDISGINLGYLVRARIKIKKVEELFRGKRHYPHGNPLFSRPPLLLEACLGEQCLSLLNLHLRSMRGINSKKYAKRVIQKRGLQADTIAKWVNDFQNDVGGRSLIVLGDFNALRPCDNKVDVVGIIQGDIAKKRLVFKAKDRVDPNLIDLSAQIPKAKRYSYIYQRKKQQLDYLMMNRHAKLKLVSIRFGRIDKRLSDHAGLFARLNW